MSEIRGYSLYRGFRLYAPLEGELLLNESGGFHVHAVISSFPFTDVELVRIPDLAAATVDEAIGLSMTHAMRLAEDGWWPSADILRSGDIPYLIAA